MSWPPDTRATTSSALQGSTSRRSHQDQVPASMTGLDRASGPETWSLSSSHTTPAPTTQKERLTQWSQGSYRVDMAESHTHTHHKTLEVQESRAVASGEWGHATPVPLTMTERGSRGVSKIPPRPPCSPLAPHSIVLFLSAQRSDRCTGVRS